MCSKCRALDKMTPMSDVPSALCFMAGSRGTPVLNQKPHDYSPFSSDYSVYTRDSACESHFESLCPESSGHFSDTGSGRDKENGPPDDMPRQLSPFGDLGFTSLNLAFESCDGAAVL